MTLHRRPLAAFLLSFVTAAGCAGTETDNPVVGGNSPDYRSPVRFEPEPPGGPGACVPSEDDAPPQLPLWGKSGNYLVGVDAVGVVPRRGLVVVDVSDPAAPRVVSELPLYGYPRQLLVEGDIVTLVIDEFALFAGPPVPAPEELETHTKLVRFDLSDPAAPVRVAEAALEGEFWQMVARADGYSVMSARIDPATLRCDVQPNLCGYVRREAMLFARYEWTGTTFAPAEQVELPAGPRAWLTEQGFATATGGDDTATLHFAAFAGDGTLLPPRTVELGGAVVARSPLYFDGEHVGVFLYDLTDGDAAFSLRDLDGVEVGRVDGLGQGLGPWTHFLPGVALVAANDAGGAATIIDFSDPQAIRSRKAPEAMALLPIATTSSAQRLLGWQASAGAENVSFSLWSVEGAQITLLDRLATSLSAPREPSDIELDGARVLLSLREPPALPVLVSVSTAGDQLVLEGPIAGGYGDQRLGVGDWVFEPDSLGLAFGNPATKAARRQTWGEGDPQDVAAIPGGEARLLLRYEDGMYLQVVRDGVSETVAVSPGARRVLPAGDRLLVLSTEPRDQCSQTGLDCSDYSPGISILALDPLHGVAQLPLPEPPGASGSDVSWDVAVDGLQAPVRLDEQRWLLEGELTAADLTAQRAFYVLDAAAGSVSEPLVVDGARGAPLDLWLRPILSQGVLLDLHLDPSYYGRNGGQRPAASAFWLERYLSNASGGLDALTPVNVPGYPVGLLEDGSLVSVEAAAGANATAKLYRSRLSADAAEVIASRAVEARFGGAKLVGQTLVYVRLPSDPCDPVTQLQTYALDGDLSPRGSLELPGDDWRVVTVGETEIVLELPDQRSFARVAVDARGTPSLAGFATAPSVVSSVSVDGNAVVGLSGSQVMRIPL
jgi:hypothetical protein